MPDQFIGLRSAPSIVSWLSDPFVSPLRLRLGSGSGSRARNVEW